MKNPLDRVPYAAGGIVLSTAALGNLLSRYSEVFPAVFGGISALFLLFLLLKVILSPRKFLEAVMNPASGGALAALPMGMMILSTYLPRWNPGFGRALWWAGVGLHLALILLFSLRNLRGFAIGKLYPGYFVMYVGIVAGSIASAAHGEQEIGRWLFYFGLAAYVVLLPALLYRFFVIKNIPVAVQPTLAIFTAPSNLCLVGYVSVFDDPQPWLLYLLLGLSVVLFAMVLILLPKLIHRPFNPAFSAFTFPFVITAAAYHIMMPRLGLGAAAHAVSVFAAVMVCCILALYAASIVRGGSAAPKAG